MTVLHIFAANLRRFRKQAGLSQEVFAERCGLHRTYISAVEREKRNISLANVEKIARTLGVPTYWLFLDPPSDGTPDAQIAVMLPPRYHALEASGKKDGFVTPSGRP